MNGCSALNLSPCFAPITNWWMSVEQWWPWLEFGAACIAILIVLGLVQRVFGWGGVVAAMGAIAYGIGYFRGQHREPLNPLPQQPTPTPVVPPKPTQRR